MASGDFPKQIKLTSKSVGWSSKDINSWIESKVSRLSNHDEVK
jgi:predicted DNA-binding transcriptional regulator AlpA